MALLFRDPELEVKVTVLKGEGTHNILYGSTTINMGTRSAPGYLARPDEGGQFPTVIIAHDHLGLRSYLKDLGRKFARHGISVIIPDLFRGAPLPGWRNDKPLPEWPTVERSMRSLEDAYHFAVSDDTPWASGDPVIVLGIGEGAEPAVAFAMEVPDVAGLILVGGSLEESDAQLPFPILGLYGGQDPALEVTHRVPHMELVTYRGVPKRFLDDDSDDFDGPAAADALDRLVTFIREVGAVGG